MTNNLGKRFTDIITHRFTLRFLFAIFIFCVAIASGVIGFMWIEDYDLGEAFYMTMLTISTVGFNEVKPLSPDGRLFTSILIIFNIGAVAYAIGVVSSFILEGDFKVLFNETKMENTIQSLENHIIVCGYGRLARVICENMQPSGKPILIVESNEEIIEELKEKDKLFYQGDATEDETLQNIGIEKAATIITTFHSDAANVFVTLAARERNKSATIISRASEEANISKLKLAGATDVVIPENIGGTHIARIVNGNQ